MTDAPTTTTTPNLAATPASPTPPVVVSSRAELRAARAALSGEDVAVVMTMGALHEGHAELIREARRAAEHVILTIFLNPLQFGPKEDLSRYPRTFDDDMAIATALNRAETQSSAHQRINGIQANVVRLFEMSSNDITGPQNVSANAAASAAPPGRVNRANSRYAPQPSNTM